MVHTYRRLLVSALAPADVLYRFRQLAGEKGWLVVSEDEVTVHARSGLSLRSAGENVMVSVQADGEGSQVDLVVTPRAGWLQLFDWGEGSIFAREIADRLQAAESPRR